MIRSESVRFGVVAPDAPIDVLVIGSGASGLAAAVSAERAGARVAVATKTTLQANNSSKAQGGIQAALGEDDSPDLHAEDVMRSSHETADARLVEVLTSEAPSAIAWLEELGCSFTRDVPTADLRAVAATGSPAAAGRPGGACSRWATGPATRSRRPSARDSRQATEPCSRTTG